jgi:hypothetical protein
MNLEFGEFQVYSTENGAIVDGPNPDGPRGSFVILDRNSNGDVVIRLDSDVMSPFDQEYYQFLNTLPLGDFIAAIRAAQKLTNN